jgi:hypothetical protein
MNAESEWIVAEVPELRIIDDELWQAVKARQSEIADKYVNVTEAIREAHSNRLNGLRRPKGAVFRVDPLRRLRWSLLTARPGPLCLFSPCYQWLLREHPHDHTD